jgi:hypothetical protein
MCRLALLTLALFAAAPAGAQGTRGFFLNGHTQWAVLSGEDGDTGEEFSDGGPGLGIRLGYGFNQRIAAYLGLEGISIFPDEGAGALEDENYSLAMVDLGARYHFPAGPSLVPFAAAAFTAQAVTFDLEASSTDVHARGGGFTIGGGAQYFLGRTVALEADANLTLCTFTEVEFDGPEGDVTFDLEDTDGTIVRLALGVTYWPTRR